MRRLIVFGAALLLGAAAGAASGADQRRILRQVDFVQNLGAQIPPDAGFVDESGKDVHLADYFGRKPVILALVYYGCPMLCTETLNGLTRVARGLSFQAGKDFNVVVVSFDPRDKPSMAAEKKRTTMERCGRPGTEPGWAFLTGQGKSIRRLTSAAGFHYAYDPALGQYAHPAGILVLTPEGKVCRYLFGVEYPPRDVKWALMDAAAGKIGSPADKLLLACYRYDPATGTYGFVIMGALRIAGAATALALGSFILLSVRRERKV